MRLLARLFLLVLGLGLAIPAGALALVVGALMEPAAQELLAAWGIALLDGLFALAAGEGEPDVLAGAAVMGLWALAMALAVAPPAFTALAGEVIGTRAFAFYGGACGLVTAGTPWLVRPRGTVAGLAGAEGRITALLFLSGAVAGLVYWAVAGRSAGRDPAPPPAAPGWESDTPRAGR